MYVFFFLMIRRPPRSTLFPYTDALPISRRRELEPIRGASRLQLAFQADIASDAYLHERSVGTAGQSLGRPLLQAVHVFEPVPSLYRIYGLAELRPLAAAIRVHENPEDPPRLLTLSINL